MRSISDGETACCIAGGEWLRGLGSRLREAAVLIGMKLSNWAGFRLIQPFIPKNRNLHVGKTRCPKSIIPSSVRRTLKTTFPYSSSASAVERLLYVFR
jgi:hypothetical protein